MRANEFIVEGWYDDAKAKVGSWNDAAKNSAAGKFVGHHAGELGKMGSDIGQATGGVGDWLKSQMYRYGGVGGQSGNIAATKSIFINNFKQEYNQISKSAKKSGMDVPPIAEFANDYIAQAGWKANPAQIDKMVAASGGDIDKVANGVYAVAMTNRATTQKGNPAQTAQGKPATAPTQTASGQEIELAPTTDKIIKTIQNMTGTSYADDLERIANNALQQLYGSNKSAYAAARKAIINPAQSTERIEPTMSESSRKIVKISSRHK